MIYCSMCGAEISKEEDKFYLEDGKIVCHECYDEIHIHEKGREK